MQAEDIPPGWCQCGCGGKTSLAPKTRPARGQIKGQPMRFIQAHNHRSARRPLEDRYWEKVDASAGPIACWPWLAYRSPKGYGMLARSSEGKSPIAASRLAWEFTVGPIPKGMLVCHVCDNPSCCNPLHLFLGTPADNMADMIRKGRQNPARGEASGTAKLSNDDVRSIRRLLASGLPQYEIAAKFGVHSTQVCRINTGERWSHVD